MLSVSRGFRNLAYFGQRLQTKFLSFGPITHKLSMTTPQSSTFCYTFHKIYNLVQMATCVELYFVQFHFERIYQQRCQDSRCYINWKNNHFAGFLLKKSEEQRLCYLPAKLCIIKMIRQTSGILNIIYRNLWPVSQTCEIYIRWHDFTLISMII